LGGAYSLWLFNRLAYGNFKTQFILHSVDVNRREFYCFVPLVFLVLILGIFPEFFSKIVAHIMCEPY